MKTNRRYELTIEFSRESYNTGIVPPLSFSPFTVGAIKSASARYDAVTINNPLTLNFDVQRNQLRSANVANLTVLNLGEDLRRRIYHDRFDTTTYRRMILKAGYSEKGNERLSVIFQGNIKQAFSVRRVTEWETHIEGYDGGDAIINSIVSRTFIAGTKMSEIMTGVVNTMKLPINSISLYPEVNKRAFVAFGNSWDVLYTMRPIGTTTYIDNEQVNIITSNQYIPSEQITIDSEMGILETPQRSDALITVIMLFEPRLKIGQGVDLRSIAGANNGFYKVVGIEHSGTISEAVGGKCTTKVTLYAGEIPLEQAP